MNDQEAERQDTGHHHVTPRPDLMRTGRSRGQSNFKSNEDVKLATAYAVVSTDAAIGTDQNCSTFWNKILDHFIKIGGGVERTSNSLQNRFNKVLQLEVQKYIGFFQGVLREYHSEWAMDDYAKEAKRHFLTRMKKPFKHDLVFDALKRMPKYELVLKDIDVRTARALNLLDADAELQASAFDGLAQEDRSDKTANAPHAALLMTPRPAIGKRKAKDIEFKSKMNLKRQDVVPDGRSAALTRLAQAAEAKNLLHEGQMRLQQEQMRLQEEQMMMQVHLTNPTSETSRAFFLALSMKYNQVYLNPAVIVASPVTNDLSTFVSSTDVSSLSGDGGVEDIVANVANDDDKAIEDAVDDEDAPVANFNDNDNNI